MGSLALTMASDLSSHPSRCSCSEGRTRGSAVCGTSASAASYAGSEMDSSPRMNRGWTADYRAAPPKKPAGTTGQTETAETSSSLLVTASPPQCLPGSAQDSRSR